MTFKRLKHFIPFLILFLLLSLLWRELFSANPAQISGSLVGETLPAFNLPTLANPEKKLSSKDLKGKVTLLNVWASWCSACNMEHEMLMKIKNDYHIPIYGILYKDKPQDALRWLIKKGNPYINVGNDYNGDVAIDLGLYGTPETFIISPEGKIVYRQTGVIDQHVWKHVMYPIIKQYEKKT